MLASTMLRHRQEGKLTTNRHSGHDALAQPLVTFGCPAVPGGPWLMATVCRLSSHTSRRIKEVAIEVLQEKLLGRPGSGFLGVPVAIRCRPFSPSLGDDSE